MVRVLTYLCSHRRALAVLWSCVSSATHLPVEASQEVQVVRAWWPLTTLQIPVTRVSSCPSAKTVHGLTSVRQRACPSLVRSASAAPTSSASTCALVRFTCPPKWKALFASTTRVCLLIAGSPLSLLSSTFPQSQRLRLQLGHDPVLDTQGPNGLLACGMLTVPPGQRLYTVDIRAPLGMLLCSCCDDDVVVAAALLLLCCCCAAAVVIDAWMCRAVEDVPLFLSSSIPMCPCVVRVSRLQRRVSDPEAGARCLTTL